ncbi:MAG: hypothetical protein RIB60_06540 [Phycisphaerales bacterium]
MRARVLLILPVCVVAGSCAVPADEPTDTGLEQRAETPGVHNLIEVSPGVYSGSMPEADAGFDTLAALGVKTVISVDGARPDVERARARSMRYVHVPVEYAGIDRDERLDLARALRDLPRPIYVHCHHGKHRGPAAAAVALGITGEITTEQALAFLDEAGTSPSYPGLWQCAREAETMPVSELDAWDAELPEVADVGGFVAGMALLDRAYDRMKLVRDAGWSVPANHPDLVPAALAGQIADVFGQLSEPTDEPEYTASEPAFTAAEMVAGLREAAAHAGALERALNAGDAAGAERSWALVAASCKDCHEMTRNK